MRARISTSRELSVLPVYSKLAGVVCGLISTTVTSTGGRAGGAGGVVCASVAGAPASSRPQRPAKARTGHGRRDRRVGMRQVLRCRTINLSGAGDNAAARRDGGREEQYR